MLEGKTRLGIIQSKAGEGGWLCAASVSHVEGPPSANMGGSAASVSHAEGPPSASMDVFGAGVRRNAMSTSI